MKNITFIWLILICLSLFALLFGWIDVSSSYIILFLFLSTFIKGKLVINCFMGLSNVRLKYKMIPTIWLLIVVVSIAIIYYLPLVEEGTF